MQFQKYEGSQSKQLGYMYMIGASKTSYVVILNHCFVILLFMYINL